MEAIVIVGGEGTRLRPLTYDTPKQMLPIVDRPLIEHVVGWLARAGVTRVVLSLCYRPNAFIDAFPGGDIGGVALDYAVEPEPLDTAGAIRYAALSAGISDRFLVVNGDILTDFDPLELVSLHESVGAEATIYLTPVEDPSAFGVVVTDDRSRVTAFIEKPPPGTAPSNLINAGVYLLETSVLERIPGGRRVSVERETFPALASAGSLFAAASDCYWLDTGTPAKYVAAQLDILHGMRRLPTSQPFIAASGPGLFVAAGARVAGDLRGVVYVGEGAQVLAGSSLSDSVVLDSARIEAGANVVGSILLPGARLGAGCVVEDSIIGPGATVGAQAKVIGLTVVRGGAEVPPGTVHEGEKIGGP